MKKIKSNYLGIKSKKLINKLEIRIRVRNLQAFFDQLMTNIFFSTKQLASKAISSVIEAKPIRNLINQPGLNKLRFGFTHLAKSERGDVPGWVLVVLMTTGLVTGIWTVAQPRLSSILKNSLDNMNSIR
jgi:hypothetical protein